MERVRFIKINKSNKLIKWIIICMFLLYGGQWWTNIPWYTHIYVLCLCDYSVEETIGKIVLSHDKQSWQNIRGKLLKYSVIVTLLSLSKRLQGCKLGISMKYVNCIENILSIFRLERNVTKPFKMIIKHFFLGTNGRVAVCCKNT